MAIFSIIYFYLPKNKSKSYLLADGPISNVSQNFEIH